MYFTFIGNPLKFCTISCGEDSFTRSVYSRILLPLFVVVVVVITISVNSIFVVVYVVVVVFIHIQKL